MKYFSKGPIFVSLVVVVVAGVWSFDTYRAHHYPEGVIASDQYQLVNMPCVPPVISGTDSWNVLSYRSYGINFKYDPSTRMSGGSSVDLLYVGMSSPSSPAGADISIDKLDYSGQFVQDFIKKDMQSHESSPMTLERQGIGCNYYYYYDDSDAIPGTSRLVTYYLVSQGHVFRFQLDYINIIGGFDINNDPAYLYFKKILATVQLTTVSQGDLNGLETYTDGQKRFTFQYPASWYLVDHSPTRTQDGEYNAVYITNDQSLISVPPYDKVHNDTNNIEVTVYTSTRPDDLESFALGNQGVVTSSNKQNLNISGTKALWNKEDVVGFDGSGPTDVQGDVMFVRNGVGYEITYTPYDSKLISKFQDMISSFIFAN